jgi:N utilization substance protein A
MDQPGRMKMRMFAAVPVILFAVGAIVIVGCRRRTEESEQTHEAGDSDVIRSLFRREVPEIVEGIVQIKAIARDAGHRTKVAVHSPDPGIDAVGACVGVKGSRINRIVEELAGENIDLVRWDPSAKIFIANALRPAEVSDITVCPELGRATVIVDDEQMLLAIGKDGQNLRLAAGLTGWDIDLLTPEAYNEEVEWLANSLEGIEGFDDTVMDKLVAFGLIPVLNVQEVGAEPLVSKLRIEASVADAIVERASDRGAEIRDQRELLEPE